MAHALRTPLTVMGSLASDLERDGKPEIAAELRQQTEVMRRNVDRELARARMASGRATVQFSPRETLERMGSAMQRMPRGGEIDWQLQRASCNGMVAVDGDDLLELFGNLLDNARKWAASVVRVSIQSGEQSLHVVIEDDGLGVADELLNAIAARGERLDETR